MAAHPASDPRDEPSPAGRALIAAALALVITGSCSAWAVYAVPRTAREVVAWGGGAAAIVIGAAVAVAVYYLQAARRFRERASSSGLEVDRLELDFARLAAETLPFLAGRVRAGAEPAGALDGAPVPSTEAVRGLLNAVAQELSLSERRAAAATAERGAFEAEVTRLAEQALPDAIRRMRGGQPADSAFPGAEYPDSTVLRVLLDTVVSEIAAAERLGGAAMAACASAASRIQAQTTRMLAELREMENRHGSDDKVFADLMELDHRVSQMGRLADSIALLAGGRSGRRWTKPIQMESILRGAMGRVDAYQRIRLHMSSTSAVVGYAAEGVMHALAELMDNAAAFSAHGSEVHVYVEEEDAGAVVTIEDGGIGMRKRERGRAEALVSESLDLATLPGTRLGLAVVGRVADRYGLSVNFRPSSRGGTGVVVMIPRQLIAAPREHAGGDLRGVAAEPNRDASQDEGTESSAPVTALPDYGDSGDDLPVRPRGRTLAAASGPAQEGIRTTVPGPSRNPGSRFAAFREAGERSRSEQSGPEDKQPGT